MDDFRFILVAWLMVMILSEDKRPKAFLPKLGMALYFIGFIALFIASFAVPQIREMFVWFALYPIVIRVVRFGVTKIVELGRGLFKRKIILVEAEDDENAAV